MDAACVFFYDGSVATSAIGRFKGERAGFFFGGHSVSGILLVNYVAGGALE